MPDVATPKQTAGVLLHNGLYQDDPADIPA